MNRRDLDPRIRRKLPKHFDTLSLRTQKNYIASIRRGFASPSDEYRANVKKQGETLHQHFENLARQNGFADRVARERKRVKKKGFKTLSKYQKHLKTRRKFRPPNQALSRLIHVRRQHLDLRQKNIAYGVGIRARRISTYANGNAIPREPVLKKILEFLETPYETIQEVVDDYPDFSRCDWNNGELEEVLAEQDMPPEETINPRDAFLKRHGFSSHEYDKSCVQARGYVNRHDYHKHRARDNGHDTPHKYTEDCLRKRGYDTWFKYQEHRARVRQQRPENKALVALMSLCRESLDISQRDIARKLGVSERCVGYYTQGKTIPRKERLQQLLEVLETPYSTLEEVVEDYPDFKRCDWSQNV